MTHVSNSNGANNETKVDVRIVTATNKIKVAMVTIIFVLVLQIGDSGSGFTSGATGSGSGIAGIVTSSDMPFSSKIIQNNLSNYTTNLGCNLIGIEKRVGVETGDGLFFSTWVFSLDGFKLICSFRQKDEG